MSADTITIRRDEHGIDEIFADLCSVHIERMDKDRFFIGITTKDGDYHQLWLGARNGKAKVDVRHYESSKEVRKIGG